MRGPFLRLQKGTQMCDLVIMKARNNLAATVCTFFLKSDIYIVMHCAMMSDQKSRSTDLTLI